MGKGTGWGYILNMYVDASCALVGVAGDNTADVVFTR
jgi:hypothetical protein